MNNTKIVNQNEKYQSKNANLEAQIVDLSAHREYEQFGDTPHQPQNPTFVHHPPSFITKQNTHNPAALSTTQEKSGLSSGKHSEQGPPLSNSNQLDSNHLSLTDQIRPRQKSSTYQQKVGQYLLAGASGMKPNLFMAEDNASPLHQPNRNLVIKPHHEEQYNPYKQHNRSSKLKNEDARYQLKKNVELETPQAELIASTEKKKARRLPSINMDANRNSQNNHLIASHDSSTIILNQKKKQERNAHFQEDMSDQAIKHKLRHIIHPLQRKTAFKFIREQQFGTNYIHPDYKIQSTDGNIQVSAKKQPLHFNSYYHITHSQFGSGIVLASLQGNFAGTEFNLYRNRLGQDELIATIIYESACGLPFRRIEVYAKSTMENDPDFHRQTQRKNLKEMYEEGYINILKLVSKTPTWNARTETYSINFGGKGKLPSTKNMILTPDSDKQNNILLFCKTEANVFHLQVGKQLSVLLSMGILMSSFDFKLLCQ